VKIDPRRVGQMMVACDVDQRFAMATLGWIALRARGSSSHLTVSARPAPPGSGYVWVSEYYRWNGARYVWVPGRYVAHVGARVPGHWRHVAGSGWYWVPGHWR
jgi:hypothetical protein